MVRKVRFDCPENSYKPFQFDGNANAAHGIAVDAECNNMFVLCYIPRPVVKLDCNILLVRNVLNSALPVGVAHSCAVFLPGQSNGSFDKMFKLAAIGEYDGQQLVRAYELGTVETHKTPSIGNVRS